MMYGRRQKSYHLPCGQWDTHYRVISVPFLFNFRAVAVLSRFQTVPNLSQGQLVRSSVRLGWQNETSLVIIAQEVSVF